MQWWVERFPTHFCPLLTGDIQSGHAQHLPLSTGRWFQLNSREIQLTELPAVHAAFGYTLMIAGITRVIEICFVLQDKPCLDEPSAFQHLTPFLLSASGFIFISATEEQLALIDSVGIDHMSYLLVLYSVAFLMYLCMTSNLPQSRKVMC